MYTFHLSETCVQKTYDQVCKAYEQIFTRLELDVKKAVASVGTMGGSKSHEYHIESPIGEDKIIVCRKCSKAASIDLFEATEGDKITSQKSLCQIIKCNNALEPTELAQTYSDPPKRCIECAHTFILGDRYTKQIPIDSKSVIMGCYGIGVSRLMQSCVEAHALDLKFPEWPVEIAPYHIAIIPAKSGSKEFEKVIILNFVNSSFCWVI